MSRLNLARTLVRALRGRPAAPSHFARIDKDGVFRPDPELARQYYERSRNR